MSPANSLMHQELSGCVNPDVCHILPFVDENDSPGMITGRVWCSEGNGVHSTMQVRLSIILDTTLLGASVNFLLPSVNLLVVAQVSFGPAMVQDRIDEEQVEPQHMSRGTSRMHPRFFRANSLYTVFHSLRSLENENSLASFSIVACLGFATMQSSCTEPEGIAGPIRRVAFS